MSEADVLLGLVREEPAFPPAGTVWERVLALAEAEGVAPLLHVRLDGAPCAVPRAVRARLRETYERTWARSSVLTAGWQDVVATMDATRGRALALKGMALLQGGYVDPALRPMADLDVLVPVSELQCAREALLRSGWAAADGEDEAAHAYRGFALLRRGGVVLDLHSDVASYPRVAAVLRVDHEALWRRARRLPGGGFVLAPEDQILHLALHLVLGSEFGRLLNFIDVDRVVRRAGGDLAWDVVVDEATRWRIRGVVGYVLGVAAAALGTQVPAEVAARLRGAVSRRFVRPFVEAARPPSLSGRAGVAGLYLAETLLMDQPRWVLRVAMTTLFPPAAWLRFQYGVRSPRSVRTARVRHLARVCALVAGLAR